MDRQDDKEGQQKRHAILFIRENISWLKEKTFANTH